MLAAKTNPRDGWLRVTAFGRTGAVHLTAPDQASR
jgi:hypothetical protein